MSLSGKKENPIWREGLFDDLRLEAYAATPAWCFQTAEVRVIEPPVHTCAYCGRTRVTRTAVCLGCGATEVVR